MGKEIRVEGREGNKINGRIYTPAIKASLKHPEAPTRNA